MKIDITALREAANKFATTLDAHRANPRDALAVTEWDEATSALTDVVGGDENNIIVALFDMLEAERQQREVLEVGRRNVEAELKTSLSAVNTLSVEFAGLHSRFEAAEAELAAIRGGQDHGDTTVYMMPNVFASLVNTARDVALEYKNAQCLRDALSRELKGYFTLSRQPKPVVVPSEVMELIAHIDDVLDNDAFERIDPKKWNAVTSLIAIGDIEAAGIVVQNGECETSFRGSSSSSTEAFRENYKSSTNCPKCGGRGAFHCPQMLGTVQCECGIVVKDGE